MACGHVSVNGTVVCMPLRYLAVVGIVVNLSHCGQKTTKGQVRGQVLSRTMSILWKGSSTLYNPTS